jgi:hypothetical protein
MRYTERNAWDVRNCHQAYSPASIRDIEAEANWVNSHIKKEVKRKNRHLIVKEVYVDSYSTCVEKEFAP